MEFWNEYESKEKKPDDAEGYKGAKDMKSKRRHRSNSSSGSGDDQDHGKEKRSKASEVNLSSKEVEDRLANEESKDTKSASEATAKSPPKFTKQPVVVGKKIGATTIKFGSLAKAPAMVKKAPVPITSVFNNDSDEDEEMPAEARMRMKNIGRDTPTSAGPNSFGKTKHGFVNTRVLTEKKLMGEDLQTE